MKDTQYTNDFIREILMILSSLQSIEPVLALTVSYTRWGTPLIQRPDRAAEGLVWDCWPTSFLFCVDNGHSLHLWPNLPHPKQPPLPVIHSLGWILPYFLQIGKVRPLVTLLCVLEPSALSLFSSFNLCTEHKHRKGMDLKTSDKIKNNCHCSISAESSPYCLL